MGEGRPGSMDNTISSDTQEPEDDDKKKQGEASPENSVSVPTDTGGMPPKSLGPDKEQLKSGIIGIGKVGSALWKLLDAIHTVYPIDPAEGYDMPEEEVSLDHLHICIPFSDKFIANTVFWIDKYHPNLVVIHSTVPPGTTRLIAKNVKKKGLLANVVHSPVEGFHPHLIDHLLAFVKVVGGLTDDAARQACLTMTDAGMASCAFDDPETTEWAKLLSLLKYAIDINFATAVSELCNDKGLNFEQLYGGWTENYNRGYSAVGKYEFMRAILQPNKGGLSGQSVYPALEILDSVVPEDSPVQILVDQGLRLGKKGPQGE
jgi:hypothetical protein